MAQVELVRELDRPRAWTLYIGGIPHSHVDLDDPLYLEFEYVRRIGHLLDLAAPPGEPLSVLHLGAGALTLARYVTATRPGSAQRAVDNDAALIELVRAELPLPARSRIRVRIGDAREVLEAMWPRSFDVVVTDVFSGGYTPAALTSAEFVQAAANALREGGILMVNVADGPPLVHTRAQVATVRSVFGQACLIADAAVLRGRRFGNLVLAASAVPLPTERLTRLTAADPVPGRVLAGAALDRFTALAKPVTDARARPSPTPPQNLFARH
jgi:SAM-dependent methyltransferase